jgi:hypothetical protein
VVAEMMKTMMKARIMSADVIVNTIATKTN